MKKNFIFCAVTMSTFAIGIASAQNSVNNASTASSHASKSVTLGITASGQATLGISAAPLIISGTATRLVGGASAAAGSASLKSTQENSTGSLPITEETISVMSPAQALQEPVR